MPSRILPAYEIREEYYSKHKRIKIIHVGAGVSGLVTAYKARKFLQNYELICYEKYAACFTETVSTSQALLNCVSRNPTIGGTWYEDR